MHNSSMHDRAMEFTDEALFARIRGDEEVALSFFEKAFVLEKKAALNAKASDKNARLIRSILHRSAANLALQCGYWWEALNLAQQALNEAPQPGIEQQLKDLLEQAKQMAKSKDGVRITITGVVTGAKTSIGELEVNDPAQNDSYTVLAPADRINEIVAAFWAKKVIIEGQAGQQGVIFLDNIRLAA